VTEFPTKTAEKEEKQFLGLSFFFSIVGVRIPFWFSVGNFHFFGRVKINFWKGGITAKLASQ